MNKMQQFWKKCQEGRRFRLTIKGMEKVIDAFSESEEG